MQAMTRMAEGKRRVNTVMSQYYQIDSQWQSKCCHIGNKCFEVRALHALVLTVKAIQNSSYRKGRQDAKTSELEITLLPYTSVVEGTSTPSRKLQKNCVPGTRGGCSTCLVLSYCSNDIFTLWSAGAGLQSW